MGNIYLMTTIVDRKIVKKYLELYQENDLQVMFNAQSCPTLCDPMNCSKPGLPVHHRLPESTQTHVHQVSNAI